jgi:hypothetical protein
MIDQGAMKAKWLAQPWAHPYLIDLPVSETAFQDTGEPYPGHWREAPEPWPDAGSAYPQRRAALRRAFANLPDLWRRVLLGRDTRLTAAERRDVLARAHGTLRSALDTNVRGDQR